jgi:hypothetical protein
MGPTACQNVRYGLTFFMTPHFLAKNFHKGSGNENSNYARHYGKQLHMCGFPNTRLKILKTAAHSSHGEKLTVAHPIDIFFIVCDTLIFITLFTLRFLGFLDNWRMKVVRLSALRTGRLYPQNIPGTHLC